MLCPKKSKWINVLVQRNFTCPKEQISLYLTVLKQYIYFENSMKTDKNSNIYISIVVALEG